MNQLPGIFRQTQHGFNRQGPLYNLRLNQTFYKQPSVSLDVKAQDKKNRLKVSRYSIDRQKEGVKRFGYKTISYDMYNDPEFIGTKGKKDQSQSYNVLIQERFKALEIVGLKVAGCRGFKDQYLLELKDIGKKYRVGLSSIENSFREEFSALRQNISELRRETGAYIKGMKTELKEFNGDLIIFCEQFKRVEKKLDKCKEGLQKLINQ